MARMTFKAGDEFALRLSRLATGSSAIAKKAIYVGAEIVADKIKANINALPEDKFRRLKADEKFKGVPSVQKEDLKNGFGITPMKRDEAGNWNARVGFDGYGKNTTAAYPSGLPNQLLARAVESGSSVRKKTPFVRPAVNETKAAVIEAMGRVIDEEIRSMK